MFRCELGFPPSSNRIWRRVGRRTLLSLEARRFRQKVLATLARRSFTPLVGRLEVELDFYPPDRRRRDLDNLPKSILDALQKGGVFEDDSQIDKLILTRCRRVFGGMTVVRIRALETEKE